MPVELKTPVDIKYINIKMKKKLKNNSEIIYVIKEAGELCVKILLFLLCCENPEKIDFEFMKSRVNAGTADDNDFLKAVDFWKEKGILDYEINAAQNIRGANMDNIINIILNISRDINALSGEESESAGTSKDSKELDEGLGIFNKFNLPRGSNKKTEEIKEVEVVEEVIEIETNEPEEAVVVLNKETESSHNISSEKLVDALESKDEFRRLIHETQVKMRCSFNTVDLGIMYYLHETNNIEVGLILKLAEECVASNKNNTRYLEKIALGMAANGIMTLSDYEEKINEAHEVKDFEDKIRELFNIDDKEFTPMDKSYIKKWVREFDFPDDVLTEGYKICLKFKGKPILAYINKVYTGWHQKGFKTLEDITGEFGGSQKSQGNSSVRKGMGFDLDQFMGNVIKERKERAEKL